jgi:site-specific DNA-methyltransferase (adenine-specific)
VTETAWETPQEFFDMLDAEFGFTVDVCALPGTAKCMRYFTPEKDGLAQDWSGETFWMNPPYGRGQDVYSWVRKAYETAAAGGTGVALLPASVDTKWFHDFVMRATEIRYVRDRLWFKKNGEQARANHGSMVVVFGKDLGNSPRISSVPNCRQIRRAATTATRGEGG